MPSSPIHVYLAYAKTDLALLEDLRIQLAAVERIGLVDGWHDGEVEIGTDREAAMLDALHHSEIILLLISADFFASEFAYEKEMKIALQLEAEGKAKVIPVILRECTWKYTPLAKLRVLPQDGIPVTDVHWHNTDRAFTHVVEAVLGVCQEMKEGRERESQSENKSQNWKRREEPLKGEGSVIEERGMVGVASFIDVRDREEYPLVQINGLLWMTKNLAFHLEDNCWGSGEEGFYYLFESALAACPPGWRLPTKAEWKSLDEEQQKLLKLSPAGLYDRGHPRDQGRKGYFWTNERSFGEEAWCFEILADQPGRVDSRYTHWAINCRCIKEA